MTDTTTNGAGAVALVNADTGEVVAREAGWWERSDLVALAADQYMPTATPAEFGLFIETARALGLSPFARQIFAVKRWDQQAGRDKWSFQVSIDGFRLVAARTGKYQGQTPRQWCGPDGAWRDVWLDAGPPAAARVGVYHADFREPLYGVATYAEYVQTAKGGGPTAMWRSKPALMIAKCAEALALRAAFPAELSGVYSDDEMQQATVGQPEVARRTVEDAARDIGVTPDVLVAWWTRERPDGLADLSDRDIATITRMSPEQLGKASASIAEWRTAEQDAAAPVVDEPAAEPKRGRGRKAAEPEAVAAEDVTVEPPAEDDPPVPEDFDDLAAAGSLDGLGTGKGPEEDDIPFGVAL